MSEWKQTFTDPPKERRNYLVALSVEAMQDIAIMYFNGVYWQYSKTGARPMIQNYPDYWQPLPPPPVEMSDPAAELEGGCE